MKHDILVQFKGAAAVRPSAEAAVDSPRSLVSMPAKSKPYGTWSSPITPEVIAQSLRLGDVQWDGRGENLVYLEQRSGRGVLVCQPVGGGGPRELTSSLPVRAQVGYGGGDFCVHGSEVYFVSSGRIYRQPLDHGPARPIIPPWGHCASPSVSPDGRWVVYVHSHEGTDVLAAVDSRGQGWPFKLAQGRDFFMQPAWHPSGGRLAWVAWDHPNMPWDGSALYLAEVGAADSRPLRLESPRRLVGDPGGRTAVSQPEFSPDGRRLAFLCDKQGWMQPWLMDLETEEARALVSEEADFCGPAWVQGMRWLTWAPDGRSLYVVRNRRGFFQLMRCDLESGTLSAVEGEAAAFTHLAQPTASPAGDGLACIGSSSSIPPCALSLRQGRVFVWRRSQPGTVADRFFSSPQAVEIPLAGSSPNGPTHCYGLYYAPRNPDFQSPGLPPAVISIHGGPTDQSVAEYRDETQFFTSRGYAVLELNYRGSTGYGRAFTESLEGNWGAADVEDAHAAAEFLARRKLADPGRLVLSGGSAGGFTVLLALIRYPGRFRAGICRYAVSNLFDLMTDTHKFESRYLDSLLGKLPRAAGRYRERSAVFHAESICDPVALFQGEDDQVVPRSQSDAIAQSLQQRGIPYLYKVYPGEGHGFRHRETLQSYYRNVEQFLRKHVVFAPPCGGSQEKGGNGSQQ